MKVLVAGGAGFIGSHLVDALLKSGHEVHAVDNLSTGSFKNIEHWVGHSQFLFLEMDIVDGVPQQEYDQIYNLASPASPRDFARMPVEILMAGSVGHKKLLDLAEQTQARILFASTSEVYGDPLVHPQPESYFGNVNFRGGRSCYDESKRFGEALTSSYQKIKNVETRTARIFNTYGTRMRPDDGRVIPNFFMQSLAGKSLTIYGDGEQSRSLCYVTDMVSGLIRLMASDYSGPVNIGGEQELTIFEVAELINLSTGNTKSFEYLELPQDDPKLRRPDLTFAKEHLEWSPEVHFEQGLLEVKKYFSRLI